MGKDKKERGKKRGIIREETGDEPLLLRISTQDETHLKRTKIIKGREKNKRNTWPYSSEIIGDHVLGSFYRQTNKKPDGIKVKRTRMAFNQPLNGRQLPRHSSGRRFLK